MSAWRFGGSALLGIGAALGLFVLMQQLVIPDKAVSAHEHDHAALEFVRLKTEPEALVPERRTRPKPPAKTAAEPLRIPQTAPQSAAAVSPKMAMVPQLPPLQPAGRFAKGPALPAVVEREGADLSGVTSMTPGTMELTVDDSELTPLVRINPVYPPQLRRRKIEGHVTARLHVNGQGNVTGVDIVESEPSGLFDATVLMALRRWKFRPRCVDGVNVPYNGIVTIEFRLLK